MQNFGEAFAGRVGSQHHGREALLRNSVRPGDPKETPGRPELQPGPLPGQLGRGRTPLGKTVRIPNRRQGGVPGRALQALGDAGRRHPHRRLLSGDHVQAVPPV